MLISFSHYTCLTQGEHVGNDSRSYDSQALSHIISLQFYNLALIHGEAGSENIRPTQDKVAGGWQSMGSYLDLGA